jgi:Yip1 domain
VSAQAEPTATSLEREWWLRLGMVFTEPARVFAWLRDDTDAAASARQEPILLVGFLAGAAGILSSNGISHALDDFGLDGIDLAVIVFIAALLYGLAGYFFIGALVYIGEQVADGLGSYRRARHILAFACAPLALSLVLWPVRLALYGEDNFKSGGSDTGTGGAVFEGIETAVVLWCLALLVLGIRTANGWSWRRTLLACAVPAIVPALAFARTYGAI